MPERVVPRLRVRAAPVDVVHRKVRGPPADAPLRLERLLVHEEEGADLGVRGLVPREDDRVLLQVLDVVRVVGQRVDVEAHEVHRARLRVVARQARRVLVEVLQRVELGRARGGVVDERRRVRVDEEVRRLVGHDVGRRVRLPLPEVRVPRLDAARVRHEEEGVRAIVAHAVHRDAQEVVDFVALRVVGQARRHDRRRADRPRGAEHHEQRRRRRVQRVLVEARREPARGALAEVALERRGVEGEDHARGQVLLDARLVVVHLRHAAPVAHVREGLADLGELAHEVHGGDRDRSLLRFALRSGRQQRRAARRRAAGPGGDAEHGQQPQRVQRHDAPGPAFLRRRPEHVGPIAGSQHGGRRLGEAAHRTLTGNIRTSQG